MWTIKDISEGDYGCEERMPGEPLMVIVTIANDAGEEMEFEAPDNWLIAQKLEVGDEWPEEVDGFEEPDETTIKQSKWMDNYLDALEELE